MRKWSLVLSLLCLMGIIFFGAPSLAQNLDDSGVDEEVAPPEKTPPPVAPPAPAAQTDRNGRWPWTSERLIQPADLAPLSLGELDLMRNEIYARHGWIFRRPDLRNYFESQAWYRPRSNNAFYSNRQVEEELSPLERRNLRIIISREHALGK